ncbi:molydbenum cofactor biosynthesis protein D (molybdopterin converting factor small subunit) [Synechococcus sp. BIOS-E4-1]|uniref:MoaD/ThiS family protein n=1 Tax=unclassified Synechococcus TaxID=2626047 RepID=UPI0007BBC269|nr:MULTISPECIES: MoaD/ThiS family protein [unclassified Synechococcus]KZR84797.1 Molybdopterin synthase sulfur carrier subunit [Synechococcus sp. MIT S9504]KZR91796.1 Molybdopterin synthase sulfur carrier subunit [Synechococcus sp. MIT S9509]QNI56875.1 molydbenum cofactor biosynthesis protein D (molybdopterin converting factor small subunit) [Synechococcus sp. BIOS-E4-1]
MKGRQSGPVDSVQVLLFASLRDQAGWSDRCFPLNDPVVQTAREIWNQLELGDLPRVVLVAINQEIVSADHPVHAGDELAFLPPFTGG